MNLSEHIENRNRFPAEELRPYENQHVAWSLDGTRILAGDTDPLRLVARLTATGYNAGEYVLSFVDAADSASAVWIDGDDANFRGAAREAILTSNSAFAGRHF